MNFRQINCISNFNRFLLPKPFQLPNTLSDKQTLLEQVKKCSMVKELECIYATMIKVCENQDCFLVNQFISASCNLFRIDYAVLAFTMMDNPNVFVYNAMIRGFVHCSLPVLALNCYVQLLKAKVMPTSYTFSSLVKACTSISGLTIGENVHGHIWKNGLESHVFVQTALIDFYSSFGRLKESRRVFDEIPEKDAFAWTTMVSVHARVGDMNSARRLFQEMPERNTATWNSMIDGFGRLGNVESAELLFNQMPVRDIISWTTMITCYSLNKRFKEALATFMDMTMEGIGPDQVTMAAIISACAHLGALELGKDMHLYVMHQGFNLDVYIGSALVDMYAKCGSLDRSLLVFFKLQDKNLFCWNSVIEGLAVHGYAEEAINMFSKMEREKIRPNGVTFVSILSACSHAGLLEEGKRRFLSMSCDYAITPEVEHYGCMVDMLSKAGMLRDALELIRNMELKPNSVIWGSLLNGCKLHKNLEIAQIAVSELMALEPDNSGHFNLLVNMYAEQSRWREVTKIRVTMKELRVEKKCPGSSWIELERKVHQFSASASFHPASDEIYLLVFELDIQLKLVGYVPDVEYIW